MATIMIKRLNVKEGIQSVKLEDGDQILSAGYRDGSICIWIKCNLYSFVPGVRLVTVIVVPTEGLLPIARAKFVGTVTQNQFDWHIFVDME